MLFELAERVGFLDTSERFKIEGPTCVLIGDKVLNDSGKMDDPGFELGCSFHNNVKALRTNLNVTQDVVSQKIGVHCVEISLYEKKYIHGLTTLLNLLNFLIFRSMPWLRGKSFVTISATLLC